MSSKAIAGRRGAPGEIEQDAEHAFRIAIRQLGEPSTLKFEFSKWADEQEAFARQIFLPDSGRHQKSNFHPAKHELIATPNFELLSSLYQIRRLSCCRRL